MLHKIGIIGDVHAQHRYLETALHYLVEQNVDTIVCTGDLVDGEGDVNACIRLLQAFNVHTVRGNHDRWILQHKVRHLPNAHLLEQDMTVEALGPWIEGCGEEMLTWEGMGPAPAGGFSR